MYGSYGAFKRLGLSTTSHREPRMTQREWMSAYGTTNNLSRVSAAERQQRRGPLPATTAQRNSQPHRSDSQAATVAAMVRAANVARQAEAERARHRAAEGLAVPRNNESKQREDEGEDDETQYSTDDEVDDVEEAKPESGIEKQARADRRLQQLRKRHKADQDKERKRREKTRRTRTLRRSQSDIQPAEEKAEHESERKDRAAGESAVSLPSLAGVDVEDVRERTRLLLREALVKTDRDATEEVRTAELDRHRRLQQQHSSNTQRKRKRRDDDDAEEKKEEESEEDQYALLASDIEQCLYEHHSFSHSTAYRQHSRSVLFSLVNNTQLTPALLSLALLPQQLVTLPTSRLASADIAQLRAKEQQEAARDAVMAVGEGSRSSEYVCGGCGGRETEWWLVKEARDMRKAEVWGGGGDDGTTIILIRCCKCNREWRKEV